MNGELSPWEAEIPKIGRSFGNGAEDTLRQIRKAAMRTFSDPAKRVAKGIAWLLKRSQAGAIRGECP